MNVEKFISPFIESQFPSFYKEEGPLFIEFMKAYYEWMESQDNVVNLSRSLMEYKDLDTTLESFLIYFKNKYINSLPENIVSDKKLLIKHILELYRSKGTEASYRFLFKMLFNEDIDIYTPGKYLFSTSSAQWKIPQYIEVTDSPYLKNLIGNQIFCGPRHATAVVENYFVKYVNRKMVSILMLSDVRGKFNYGETIFSYQVPEITTDNAPVILGSLSSIGIINGGINYRVGDILSANGNGVGAIARVAATTAKNGEVEFTLLDGGSGFSLDAIISVDGRSIKIKNITNDDPVVIETVTDHGIETGRTLRIDYVGGMTEINVEAYDYYAYVLSNTTFALYSDATLTTTVDSTAFNMYEEDTGFVYINTGGERASFNIGSIVNKEIFRINTDKVGDYTGDNLDITSEGFRLYLTNINGTFSADDDVSINDLKIREMDVEIISTETLTELGETLSNSSLSITGLTIARADESLIVIKGSETDLNNANLQPGVVLNGSSSGSKLLVNTLFPVKTVNASANVTFSNSTCIEVDFANGYFFSGEKLYNNTVTANAIISSTVRLTNWLFPSEASPTENLDTDIEDALTVIDKEVGTIASLTNLNPGVGYSENPVINIIEPLIYEMRLIDPVNKGFKGFNANVIGDAGIYNGIVTAVDVIDSGFGYSPNEMIYLHSETNPYSVSGRTVIDLNGVGKGYWLDKKGFLSDENYLQDSNYYQKYSYEIISTKMIDVYEKYVKDLVHPSGMKMFGKFRIKNELVVDSISLVESSISQS